MGRDRKLIEMACREFLMNVVQESDVLNEKLTFHQKAMLYDKIMDMKYVDMISVLVNNGKKITTEQKREFESKTKKAAKYGATATVGTYGVRKAAVYGKAAVKAGKDMGKDLKNFKKYTSGKKVPLSQYPGALKRMAQDTRSYVKAGGIKKPGWKKSTIAAVGLLYLYRKLTDLCARKHIGNKEAQMRCKMDGIKKITNEIKSNISKCESTSNPAKCKQKLNAELIKWQTKYQKNLVSVNQLKRKG